MTAAAGKPVYVEKPMALNFAECQEMIAACAHGDVPLFVAYYRRALPRFLKIKELLDSGAIGNLRFVNITFYQPMAPEDLDPARQSWRVDPAVGGGGRFVDLASHTLDFLDYALGPIVEVEGLAANQAGKYKAEDIVTGTFRFASGVQGVGTWCFSAFENSDITEVVGTEGKISFSTFDTRPIALTTHDGPTEFSLDYPQHIEQPLIQMVVNELNGVGKCPSTGETGARTSRVMDQMLGGRQSR
jgi:predicted dehydrogenase